MSQTSYLRFISLFSFLTFFVACSSLDQGDLQGVKARKYKRFELPNGMDVLAISDPFAGSSAFALQVGVGSASDPAKAFGLAHFLEHMVFLGSEKYPDPKGFDLFMQARGGSFNASTYADGTTYRLEIKHEALPAAVDRMADMIRAPLLLPDFLEKEKNAVNEEFLRRQRSDGARMYRLFEWAHKKSHPVRQFSTGNLISLKSADEKKLKKFHQQFYLPSLMKAVVYGKAPLEELEQIARQSLSWSSEKRPEKPVLDQSPFPKSPLPRYFALRPLAEMRELWLMFPLESSVKYWKTRPLEILTYMLSSERQGSLASYLKKKGWVNSVTAGHWTYNHASYLNVRIPLTQSGEGHVRHIIEQFFANIELYRKHGFQHYIYDQIHSVSRLLFDYREPSAYPSEEMSEIAEGMWTYKDNSAGQKDYILKYGPKLFERFVDQVRPENMTVLQVGPHLKVSRKEPYLNLEYSEGSFTAADLKRWQNPKNLGVNYPDENPYTPKHNKVLPLVTVKQPERIIDSPQGEIWYLGNDKLKQPKVKMRLRLLGPKISKSKERLELSFFADLLGESFNEWVNQLAEVGISLNVTDTGETIAINLEGYSEHILKIMDEVIHRIYNFNFDERQFALVKENTEEYFKNINQGEVSEIAGEFIDAKIHTVWNLRGTEKYLSQISLKSINQFGRRFLKRVAMKGFVYGNLEKSAARKSFQKIFKKNRIEFPQPQRLVESFYYDFKDKERVALRGRAATNGHAWSTYISYGDWSAKKEALLRLLSLHWGGRYFADMRSEKQLGYSVWQSWRSGGKLGLTFGIESTQYNSRHLASESEAWLSKNTKELEEITEADWQRLKDSALQKLLEPERNLSSIFWRHYNDLFLKGGRVDSKRLVVEELKKISLNDFIASHKDYIGLEKRKQVSAYIAAKNAKLPRPLSGQKKEVAFKIVE